MNTKELRQAVISGDFDERLSSLYAPDGDPGALARAKDRICRVTDSFLARFGCREDSALFSGPGRTELGGNHTDHQHGNVLCASVNLDLLSCAAPNGTGLVRIVSEGYPDLQVSLLDLEPRPEEQGSSAALVRGIAAGLTKAGFRLHGFDACIHSEVLSGSGLSSSAAYEVLIGNIFGSLSCGGSLGKTEIAKTGQYAENLYFGKPSGLMDQMASSLGGVTAIDFRDPAQPAVRQVSFDFSACGHALCIVDTASSHDNLTAEYAAIPEEMGLVAAQFGKKVLRDVPEEVFRDNIPLLRRKTGDRAVLRALHYYGENQRVLKETEALARGEFEEFLSLVNASGLSSETLLQNIWCPATPERQSVTLTLATGKELLRGSGAIRVHGGGFAGTIQAFVPLELLEEFCTGMEKLLGSERCHILRIRPEGGCKVAGS